jgi:hypothetical protein
MKVARNAQIREDKQVDWEMRQSGGILGGRSAFTCLALCAGKIRENALSTKKRCTFCSLRLLMRMAETSGSRMTQVLRHNMDGGSSLYKTLTYFRSCL